MVDTSTSSIQDLTLLECLVWIERDSLPSTIDRAHLCEITCHRILDWCNSMMKLQDMPSFWKEYLHTCGVGFSSLHRCKRSAPIRVSMITNKTTPLHRLLQKRNNIAFSDEPCFSFASSSGWRVVPWLPTPNTLFQEWVEFIRMLGRPPLYGTALWYDVGQTLCAFLIHTIHMYNFGRSMFLCSICSESVPGECISTASPTHTCTFCHQQKQNWKTSLEKYTQTQDCESP